MARVLTRLDGVKDKLLVLQLAEMFTPDFIDGIRLIAAMNGVDLPSDNSDIVELVGEACGVWLRSSKT